MSYDTGTATNTGDLLDKLATFLGGEGWTIVKNTVGTTSGSLLFAEKGECHVAFANFVANSNRYPGGVLTSVPFHHIRGALSTSLTGALTTYHSHPGSLVTSDGDGDACYTIMPVGPYGYHFFADGSYCHVVVEVPGEAYAHFSFGELDQGDFTHTGVAYLISTNPEFIQNALTLPDSNFNRPFYQSYYGTSGYIGSYEFDRQV